MPLIGDVIKLPPKIGKDVYQARDNTMDVRSVLEFSEYCIVLLMDNDIPDNNVVAIDYKGNELWNISQLVKLPYSEAFISLSKESDTSFSVVSYNGVKFVIDILTNQILSKNITK